MRILEVLKQMVPSEKVDEDTLEYWAGMLEVISSLFPFKTRSIVFQEYIEMFQSSSLFTKFCSSFLSIPLPY